MEELPLLQTFACLLRLRSKSSRGQFCSADERLLARCITSPLELLCRSEPSFLIVFFSYNDNKTAGRFSGSACAHLAISTLSHSAQPNKKVGGRPSTCSDYFLFCMYPCVCVFIGLCTSQECWAIQYTHTHTQRSLCCWRGGSLAQSMSNKGHLSL